MAVKASHRTARPTFPCWGKRLGEGLGDEAGGGATRSPNVAAGLPYSDNTWRVQATSARPRWVSCGHCGLFPFGTMLLRVPLAASRCPRHESAYSGCPPKSQFERHSSGTVQWVTHDAVHVFVLSTLRVLLSSGVELAIR
ncbi:Hypothetical protein, putative [Bodo saltans]|uniref:Uncharacterized protein n=1 Tax=Bodo saltans TaxID=75058 RepID=A0A0S4JK11_BODSA|nr:Hypothetical protein, putative [Bodo saltans]|eukprot:CUG90431.1 Hypothetical protein, putative [Bodo saltans]